MQMVIPFFSGVGDNDKGACSGVFLMLNRITNHCCSKHAQKLAGHTLQTIFFRDFYTEHVMGYNWHHAFPEGKIVHDYLQLNFMLTFPDRNMNESQASQGF
jgi:hypothetical protein